MRRPKRRRARRPGMKGEDSSPWLGGQFDHHSALMVGQEPGVNPLPLTTSADGWPKPVVLVNECHRPQAEKADLAAPVAGQPFTEGLRTGSGRASEAIRICHAFTACGFGRPPRPQSRANAAFSASAAAAGTMRRHVAAERGDLLDQARAHEPVLDRRHEEHQIDLGREHPVVVRELHLRVEVADRAQAADDRAGATGAAEVDGQPVERGDLEAFGIDRLGLEDGADDPDAGVHRQERRLAWVGEDRDDEPVEHGARPPDDVDVAVGHRVERAGVDRESHRSSWRR